MLKNIFSSKNKYYLELKDEVTDSEVVQTAVKQAEKTATAVKEKAQEVAQSEPVQSTVKTAEEAVETAQEKVTAIATEEKPSKSKAAKAGKKGKAEQNGKVAPQEAKPTPANSGASSFDPPFWVAAMNNTNKGKTNSNGQVAEQTFATDNLLPTPTKYRRRPGGSLNKFKDMAKSAKTPK